MKLHQHIMKQRCRQPRQLDDPDEAYFVIYHR